MHILIVFCDGMGLGSDDPYTNPFFHAPMLTLRALFGKIPAHGDTILYGENAILVPTDARLGIAGVPQSGTGQTAIFTGVNAAAAIGEHLGPYPNEALREILKEHSVFKSSTRWDVRRRSRVPTPLSLLNGLPAAKRPHRYASGRALAGGVRVRDVNDLAKGKAVSGLSMDNHYWLENGAPVPLITASIAGQNLMHLAQEFDFTAFEYAPTDMAGHKDNRGEILRVLNELDEFLEGIISTMDSQNDLVLITSDHGNIEDWTAERAHAEDRADDSDWRGA